MGVDIVSIPDTEIVEVYRRLAELPAELAAMNVLACGAIAIWTRRGR